MPSESFRWVPPNFFASIGRTVTRTDQQGDTCEYEYDLAGRLLSKDYFGHASGQLNEVTDSDTFTYDAASRMLTAVSGRYSNTVTYTYDTAGRKSTEALTISGQTYTVSTTYDAAGQVSGYTYPDGKVVGRTYSDRGQLATLVYDSTTIDTRAYDDGGRMTSSSYNNGISESRTYNDDNTLAGISFTGASIGNLTYGWDANKNKTSESIGGTMSGYGFTVGSSGYDNEDRLVNWERADTNLDQSWDLSLVGDWDSITENSSTQNRTHGPTHELVSVASQSVTHDAKGNMMLIPAVLRGSSQTPQHPLKMKWDFENKLLAADINNDNTDDVFYKFDALGRRVARTANSATTVYFQSGQQTIADYTAGTAANSPTYNYVYASYIDEPVMRSTGSAGARHYFHRNQQYSITAVTDGGGSVVERYAYSAYGRVTFADASGSQISNSAISNRYTYTGREWDEGLSLCHYRTRLYDPFIGRFLSRDDIGFRGSQWNLFEYVKGRPHILVDPMGRQGHQVKKCCGRKSYTDSVRPKFGCCNGVLYTLADQCCENGTLVDKVSIWRCKRYMDSRGLGSSIWHHYFCCNGNNDGCYGMVPDVLKGENVPEEKIKGGKCKEHKVCPSFKKSKCDNPVAPFTYCWYTGDHCWKWGTVPRYNSR